jgi:hypothetical protein
MTAVRVVWTDIGDADAYRRAVADVSGYDWTKTNEATFIEGDRVVKYFDDEQVLRTRVARQHDLGCTVPTLLDSTKNMMAYEYVPGPTMYEYLDHDRWRARSVVLDLLDWAEAELWIPRKFYGHTQQAALAFYLRKTWDRIKMLEPGLQRVASSAFSSVNFPQLEQACTRVRPARIHGDFNFGNIIVPSTGDGRHFVGIDWRGDFGGQVDWGDMRYDVGKLLAGCVVHWDNARRGDFRRWPLGEEFADEIRQWAWHHELQDVELIGALSLLNSAPLHASPLDEILVMRGVHWLEEATS